MSDTNRPPNREFHSFWITPQAKETTILFGILMLPWSMNFPNAWFAFVGCSEVVLRIFYVHHDPFALTYLGKVLLVLYFLHSPWDQTDVFA